MWFVVFSKLAFILFQQVSPVINFNVTSLSHTFGHRLGLRLPIFHGFASCPSLNVVVKGFPMTPKPSSGINSSIGAWSFPVLCPLILVVLASGAHLSSLWNGFIWDDRTVFLSNPVMRDPQGLLAIWEGRGLPDYLPLSWSLFRLCLSLFGENPLFYHLLNLSLHATSVLLLWRLLVSIKVPGAFWGAALFAVHPLGVASVGWISELKNTLSLALSLGASLAFFSFSARSRVLSIPLFLLALLSKGSVVSLPLVWALIMQWRSLAGIRVTLRRILPHLCLSLIAGVATLWFQVHGATHHDFAANTLPFSIKIFRAVWAAGFYLSQTIWPDHLSMLYASRSPGDGNPGPWIAAVAGASITALAFYESLKKKSPWAKGWLVTISSYLLLISPVLGLLPMYYLRLAPVADHWLYLPSIPLMAFAGAIVQRIPNHAARVILGLLAISILSLISMISHGKLRNDKSLWESVLAVSPQSWYASMNLSVVPAMDDAERERLARQAVKFGPKEPETLLNLAKVLSVEGKNEEALTVISKGCVDFPSADVFPLIQGKIFARMNRLKEARESFRKARGINPSSDEAALCDAQTSNALGESSAMIEPLSAYLERHPGDGANWFLIGGALSDAGFHEGALKAFEKAVELCPEVPEIRIRLARERDFNHL